MDPLFETLLLNNEAATLFQSNQCLSQAADAYHKSLCNVRSLLRHKTIMDPALRPNEQLCCHFSMPTSQAPSTSYLKSNFYIFQRALFLNFGQTTPYYPQQHQEQIQSLPIYGAVVLFNTAILYHKNATLTGESINLDKAEQLYKASLQFATAQGATNPTLWLIAIAASNNLSHIAYEKGMIADVNDWLNDMSFLVSRGGSIEKLQSIFTVDEIQGFLSNSAMAGGFKSSPAA